MKKKILLIGGGGHCSVVIDAIQKSGAFDIFGIVDPNLPAATSLLDIPVIGSDDKLSETYNSGVKNAFIAVGSIGDCTVRKELFARLKEIGFTLPAIVHPDAVVADSASIAEGAFVAAGAVVNPMAKIGANAIINTRASIDHDCDIGKFVHIAPGATLSGGVKIDDGIHIGTSAVVIQYLHIKKEYTCQKNNKYLIPAGSIVFEGKNGTIQYRLNQFAELSKLV